MIGGLRRVTYLLRVLEVLKEGLLLPCDTLVYVSGGVGVAVRLTTLAAENAGDRKNASSMHRHHIHQRVYIPVQVRADLVGLTSTDSVALSAASLEETSALSSVTYTRPSMSSLSRTFPSVSDASYRVRKACLKSRGGRKTKLGRGRCTGTEGGKSRGSCDESNPLKFRL